jgi:hypothetical protein
MTKLKGERKMNEKLQYASMLEIPVNTCNVTVKTGKARKKKKKVDTEQVKSKLIQKVNSEVEDAKFLPSANEEVFQDGAKSDNEWLEQEEKVSVTTKKRKGFSVISAQIAVIGILIFDFFALYGQTSTYFEYFMFFGAFALGILYLIMRPYIYLMLITFELNIRKLFKNALIFSALGIKRNVMMLLGNFVIIALTLFLMLLLLPSGLGIMIILPFFYLFGLCAFISAYSAYPIIQRYMIDPYAEDNANAQENEPESAYEE